MKKILLIVFLLVLTGCANIHMKLAQEEPIKLEPRKQLSEMIPELDGPPITIAVYGFTDKTGQKKPSTNLALFSSAVTQGAEVFLIKALQDAGKGKWFQVVERVGLDDLIKERQLIRNQRETYEGKDAKPLMPLQFAGILMEGGIIGYDTGSESGGAAYRFLGIGPSTQYSKDTVTISLRAISVNTGKVLAAVTVTKIVYSTADAVAVLKYIDNTNIFGIKSKNF